MWVGFAGLHAARRDGVALVLFSPAYSGATVYLQVFLGIES